MRYTFVNAGDKEVLLKRCYRQFQLLVAILVTTLVVFILVFPASVHGIHGVFVVLVFSGLGIGSTLYLRSRHKRYAIEPAELLSYMMRQPMMIAAQIIMAIFVIVQLYRVFFPK